MPAIFWPKIVGLVLLLTVSSGPVYSAEILVPSLRKGCSGLFQKAKDLKDFRGALRLSSEPYAPISPNVTKASQFNGRLRKWMADGKDPLLCPMPEAWDAFHVLRSKFQDHWPKLVPLLKRFQEMGETDLKAFAAKHKIENHQVLFVRMRFLQEILRHAKLNADAISNMSIDSLKYGEMSRLGLIMSVTLSFWTSDFKESQLDLDELDLYEVNAFLTEHKNNFAAAVAIFRGTNDQEAYSFLSLADEISHPEQARRHLEEVHLGRFPILNLAEPFELLVSFPFLMSFETVYHSGVFPVDYFMMRAGRTHIHDRAHRRFIQDELNTIWDRDSNASIRVAQKFTKYLAVFINHVLPGSFSGVERKALFVAMTQIALRHYHELASSMEPRVFMTGLDELISRLVDLGYYSGALYPISNHIDGALDSLGTTDDEKVRALLLGARMLRRMTALYLRGEYKYLEGLESFEAIERLEGRSQ